MSGRKTASHSGKDRKLVLLVEDDGGVKDSLLNVFQFYQDVITVETMANATEVLPFIKGSPGHSRPDAILLDLMMPYGSARAILDENYTDLDDTETGLRLLKYLRRIEKSIGRKPIWVAIITARSPFALKSLGKGLIDRHCNVYYKPFETFQLEDDLMKALGLQSKVPPGVLASSDTEIEKGPKA